MMYPPTDFPEEDLSATYPDPIPHHPLPTRAKSIGLYLLIFYFIGLGLIQIATNLNYSTTQTTLTCIALTCSGTITTTDALSTHYIYLKQWNSIQKDMMTPVYTANCNPYCTNQQLNKTISYIHTPLLPSLTASPSGRYQSQFPQGVLSLQNTAGTVSINQSDLTVLTVLTALTVLTPSPSLSWTDITSQLYGQWSEDSVSLSLMKLWGVAQMSGTYTVTFTSKQHAANMEIVIQNGKSLSGYNIPFIVISMLFAAVLGVISPMYSSYLGGERIIDGNEQINTEYDKAEEKSQDRSEESVVRIIVNPLVKQASIVNLDKLFAEVQALRDKIEDAKGE